MSRVEQFLLGSGHNRAAVHVGLVNNMPDAAMRATELQFARLLKEAGEEIGKMIVALDASGELPVALCGGLGKPLRDYVPQHFQARLRAPLADSAHGAWQLAQQEAQRLGLNLAA